MTHKFVGTWREWIEIPPRSNIKMGEPFRVCEFVDDGLLYVRTASNYQEFVEPEELDYFTKEHVGPVAQVVRVPRS